MTERPSRNRRPTDLWDMVAVFVAVCALGVSVVQVQMMRKQQFAEIWPHILLDIQMPPDTIRLTLRNAGVGPGLIKWAQVRVDDHPIASWDELLFGQEPPAPLVTDSLAVVYRASMTGNALTPSAVYEILKLTGAGAAQLRALNHRFLVRVCYCSVDDTCWRYDSQPFTGALLPVQSTTSDDCARPREPVL